MAQYATKDELNELVVLVRNLQGDINTLDTSVGELDTLVERINHLATLKDVTITYITEGDLLQYSSDGTWHNIQPSALGIGGEGGGGIVDTSVVKAMIKQEGSKLFLSKLQDDQAAGIITFNNGLVSNKMTYLKEGVQIGHFVSGMIGGTGAQIDKDGRGEMTSLILREFLEVPELRFNKIDVVSGELWNSIAFGTIEDVDIANQIVTVKLEEGEYSGIKVNDICRGIFHNLGSGNDTESKPDENGFDTVAGFSTSYFTPIEVLDSFGKQFRYTLKPGTTQHPSKSMKFVVYGNFTDPNRRSSAYATRTYKRYLKDVNTWQIDWTNIASQFGLLDGLNIPGGPNDGNLTGDGAYLTNVYMTGALIQFTPEQMDEMKGHDAYSVSLSRETATIILDNNLNIIDEYNQLNQLTFAIQAFKGPVELAYSDVYGEGTYFVEYEATGLKCTMSNGVFRITEITNVSNMRINITVNCEGLALFKKEFLLNYQLEGDALWVTYNDNDAVPSRPTGRGETDGWHRNYTASAIWMSTKSSRRIEEGEWGDPVRFVGASVQGEDGQYTAFCYTNSSVQPETPTSTQIPPSDSVTTWYMYPPERESTDVFTWMTQATVYADKSLSGWTKPIRITGETGEDGADGTKIEFIYTLFTPTNDKPRPDTPSTSQQDDYIPFGWSDNPQGVSKEKQYEWVSTREKKAAKIGEGNWSEFSQPVVWSKWGEKGMDGDGYEYIFTRTADVDKIPSTPSSIQQNDYIPTISNGGSTDYNWSDDPKGVNETYKAEWTCKRVRTDGVWSDFSTPALWSNWGEQGLSGGHYQYRWKVSSTKPNTTPDNDSSWSTNSEQTIEQGQYVWQIQRFVNPDGTTTAWGNIIRLTGADGKDGEDGNSIEFLYARNSTGVIPQKPADNQTTDWTGKGPDGTEWTDNPQGVTPNLTYEYVCQRYKDKATQLWESYSTPGVWARYSERGKDGDGYEYIYIRQSTWKSQGQLNPSSDPVYIADGNIYPPADVESDAYQNDDYVPNGYTDNPETVNSSIKYQYVWTRKKEGGKWKAWKNGSLWTNFAVDGEQGEPGTPGAPGGSITVSGAPASIRSKLGFLQTTSCTLRAIRTNTSGITQSANGNYAVYYKRSSSGSWSKADSGSGTSYQLSWSSSLNAEYFWFGFSTDTTPSPTGTYNVWSVEVPVVYDGKDGTDGGSSNSEYTIMRDRGAWTARVTYYNDRATNAMKGLSISSVIAKYKPSNDLNEKYIDGAWSSQPPSSISGYNYVLAVCIVIFSDGTSTVSQPVKIANSGVSSVTIQYGVSSSSYTPSSWSSSYPSISSSYPYGWARFIANGSTSSATCIARFINEYSKYDNYENLTVIDYVIYYGNIYLCKRNNTAQEPSMTSDYWEVSSKIGVLSINNLLANNAQLGQFNFSNNVFASANGNLQMNSENGAIRCKDAYIHGIVEATSGVFTGTVNAQAGIFTNINILSGNIAGFSISGNDFVNNATNASIRFKLTGNSFLQINNPSYSGLIDVRNDNGIAIRAQAYGSNSAGLSVIAQAGSPTSTKAIESTGSCQFVTRDNERILINGLCVNTVTVTSSYNAKTSDDFIVCNNPSNITISFPSVGTFYKGKIYYIKSVNTGNLTVSGGIRLAGQRGTRYSQSYSDNKIRGFIFDGSYWNEMFFSN